MHDAEPGDIYVDESGKLWRVQSYCKDPTVELVEVETDGSCRKPIHRGGSVYGMMWQGFKRIYRLEAANVN